MTNSHKVKDVLKELFSLKAPSKMFDWALITPLDIALDLVINNPLEETPYSNTKEVGGEVFCLPEQALEEVITFCVERFQVYFQYFSVYFNYNSSIFQLYFKYISSKDFQYIFQK